MKILLVIDQFGDANNGTTISAMRFADMLKQHGHEVRVVSTGDEEEGKYVVQEWHMPFFDRIIKEQGMAFARPDKVLLEEATRSVDVVHFLMPFALSIEGRKIAERLGVPHTAAFHVQPENITYTIGMGKWTGLNTAIYRGFRDLFYNHFRRIHCPSNFIAGELRKNGYTAQLHVISNGIDGDFVYRKAEKSPELADKFVILNIGRFSNEKRQDILIEAAARSKYADRIQLVFAGQGPNQKKYEQLAEKLPHAPIMRFFTKAELMDIMAMSDLYVHAADAEIEAISCMEAFASGLVPVIANSAKSATPQFALDERSLFTAGDSGDLTQKIDYWLEHEDERREMEKRYVEHGRQYSLDHCVRQIEEMFLQEIRENEGVKQHAAH